MAKGTKPTPSAPSGKARGEGADLNHASAPDPRKGAINAGNPTPGKLSTPAKADTLALMGKGDASNSKYFGVSGLPAQSNPDL